MAEKSFDSFAVENSGKGVGSSASKLFKSEVTVETSGRSNFGALRESMLGGVKSTSSKDTNDIIKSIKERLEVETEDIDCLVLSMDGAYGDGLSYDYLLFVTTEDDEDGQGHTLYVCLPIAISGIQSESIKSVVDIIEADKIPVLPGVAVNENLIPIIEDVLRDQYPENNTIMLAGTSVIFTKDPQEVIEKTNIGVNLLTALGRTINGKDSLDKLINQFLNAFELTKEEEKQGLMPPFTKCTFSITGEDMETVGKQQLRCDFTSEYTITINSTDRGGANAGGKKITICNVTGYVTVIPTEYRVDKDVNIRLHPSIVITSITSPKPHPMIATFGIYVVSMLISKKRWAKVLASVVSRGVNPGILNILLKNNKGDQMPIVDLTDKTLSVDKIAEELAYMVDGNPMISAEVSPEYGSIFEPFVVANDSVEMNDSLINILYNLGGNVGSVRSVVAGISKTYSGTLITSNGDISMSRLDLMTIISQTHKSKDAEAIINDYIGYLTGRLPEVDKLRVIEYITPNVTINGVTTVIRFNGHYIDAVVSTLVKTKFNPYIPNDMGINVRGKGYGDINELMEAASVSSSTVHANTGYSRNGAKKSNVDYRVAQSRYW